MVNYSDGKIYKIEPICEHKEGEIYIGSTAQKRLCDRFGGHKRTFKRGSGTSACILFKKYGVENCCIVLLELVDASSKEELFMREAFYIKTLKNVNKCIPLRTPKEYYCDNKDTIIEQNKQYYCDNKDKISEQMKQYRVDNKDKISEKKKQYRVDNNDKISEKSKQHYCDNKDKISEKSKQYYSENKDTIIEKRKQYRVDNKDKISEQKKQYRLKSKIQLLT